MHHKKNVCHKSVISSYFLYITLFSYKIPSPAGGPTFLLDKKSRQKNQPLLKNA